MDKAVRSMLDAASDLEMLGFESKAKPERNDVNHKFRDLSRSVHPDKNMHPDASQAQQKLIAARDRLLQEIQKREAAEEAKRRARAASAAIRRPVAPAPYVPSDRIERYAIASAKAAVATYIFSKSTLEQILF